jgi:hypothetical protein
MTASPHYFVALGATEDGTCSANVNASALRLFMSGYLGALRWDGTYHDEDGHEHHTWILPSETRAGTSYVLDHDTATKQIACTCPAGEHETYCKHVRLIELQLGITR